MFDIEIFEKSAAWFYDFCRRMEKSGLPQLPRDEHDALLWVNIHMQIALKHLKAAEDGQSGRARGYE